VEGYFLVGYVRKKHGFKGDVVVRITADDPSPYQGLDAYFVEERGKALPFFVASHRSVNAEESIVRFDDVNDEASAQAMVGRGLWLPEDLLPELDEDQFYYHDLSGYTVINPGVAAEMTVHQVLEYPGQDLFEIDVAGRELRVLIPVIDAFIDRVDKSARVLYLKAPEELYSL
jgi:16S rRNA processing protein RimM